MNPTDQAREFCSSFPYKFSACFYIRLYFVGKEARKKELKKNKKQRQLVRHAVLKNKDPGQILEEMEQIDEMGEFHLCESTGSSVFNYIFSSTFRIQSSPAIATQRKSPQREAQKAQRNLRSCHANGARRRSGTLGRVQAKRSRL